MNIANWGILLVFLSSNISISQVLTPTSQPRFGMGPGSADTRQIGPSQTTATTAKTPTDCPFEMDAKAFYDVFIKLKDATPDHRDDKYKFSYAAPGTTASIKWAITKEQRDNLLNQFLGRFFLTKLADAVQQVEQGDRITIRCWYTATFGVLGNPEAKKLDFYMTLVR